jgi:hypothetical protein
MTGLESVKVPAPSWTTCPLGHDARALLICAAEAPAFNVTQLVVRFGMPPVTPAVLQSVARAGARIPVQGVEAANVTTPQRYIETETATAVRNHPKFFAAQECIICPFLLERRLGFPRLQP